MVAPHGTPPPDRSEQTPHSPPAPPLAGYTVPSGWGTSPAPPAPRTPGTVVAAAVLTYIRGALGILGSILLVVGGSFINELGLFWVVIGFAVFVVCVLYIVAALLLQLRRNRTFLLWLTIADIALTTIGVIDTVARAASGSPTEGGSNLCSLLLPVIVLLLLRHRNTMEWIEADRSGFGPPTR